MGAAPVTLRVVAALDSFKGSLDSLAAGEAVRRGVLAADPNASVRVVAVADGGEGTLDALAAALPSTSVPVATVDALGRPRTAAYLVLPDGTAAVEAARTIGLGLLETVDSSVPPTASSAGWGTPRARPGRRLGTGTRGVGRQREHRRRDRDAAGPGRRHHLRHREPALGDLGAATRPPCPTSPASSSSAT